MGSAHERHLARQARLIDTVRSMTAQTQDIRVGRVLIPLETAAAWVREYTHTAHNLVSEHPYAFPAYDRFDGGTTEPSRLTDGDLLAPGLLNVPVKIRSFYGLQSVRGRLEEALGDPRLDTPLAEVADREELRPVVLALYGVLDDSTTRPWGVSATTLSKVLHRKRPHSVVLHDRWVRACYVGDDAPVPVDKGRSWADYMVLITEAIRDDIANQPAAFSLLQGAVGGPGHLSDVRLLDIVAWNSKGDAPAASWDERPRDGDSFDSDHAPQTS